MHANRAAQEPLEGDSVKSGFVEEAEDFLRRIKTAHRFREILVGATVVS
jgi:hypothetical protein